MKVLVYGATGEQMRPLVAQLLDRGHEPYVLSRSSAASARLPAAARVVQGDLDDTASLHRASAGMDAVVFMLPAFLQHPHRSGQYAAAAAQAAAAAGVELIVWNTSGRYPLPGENRQSDRQMRETHEILAAAGVPLIVIAPSKYMENLLGPWTTEAVRRGTMAYPVRPERKMGWIASADVCSFIAEAVQRPALAGSVFRVSGVEAPTGPELAAIFTEVLGRPLRYQTLTPQQMKESLERAFGPGAGDEVAAEYALDQADDRPPATHYDMDPILAVLPAKMTRLRDWVAKHRAAFLEEGCRS